MPTCSFQFTRYPRYPTAVHITLGASGCRKEERRSSGFSTLSLSFSNYTVFAWSLCLAGEPEDPKVTACGALFGQPRGNAEGEIV